MRKLQLAAFDLAVVVAAAERAEIGRACRRRRRRCRSARSSRSSRPRRAPPCVVKKLIVRAHIFPAPTNDTPARPRAPAPAAAARLRSRLRKPAPGTKHAVLNADLERRLVAIAHRQIDLFAEVRGLPGRRRRVERVRLDERRLERRRCGAAEPNGPSAHRRAHVDAVGDGADDAAPQDQIDVIVGVEAEVVDGGVVGRVHLRAVEIAFLRRERPLPLMPKPGASSPEATPTSTRSRSGQWKRVRQRARRRRAASTVIGTAHRRRRACWSRRRCGRSPSPNSSSARKPPA